MKRNIYASVELGSHSIKLLVSEFINEKQNILFIDEKITAGINAGRIVDKIKVRSDLKKLVQKCEKFLNAKINSLVLMLPSVRINSKEVSYDITIPENKVRGKHIKNLFNRIYQDERNSLDEKRSTQEIAFIYPNRFTSLKIKKNIENPIGEITRELFVSLEVVYEDQKLIIDYISVVEHLGIDVIEIMPNVMGYKKSLLSKEECINNTCIIDIGADTTTITVFSNLLVKSSESFTIGGNNVTEAIKNEFTLQDEDAEDFKITHGLCLAKEASEEIVLEKRYKDGSITYFKSNDVAKIVEEKYLEIIRVIRRYLLEIGLKSKINKYILIGGAVQIEKFEKLFKNNFGENVKLRCPDLVGTRHPKYSSIISGQYNILYLEKLFEEQYQMVTFEDLK